MNWSQLSDKQKSAIRSAYESGKEPGAIAPTFGLKPKQVSDQAYRKKWKKVAKKGAAKRRPTKRPSSGKTARRGKAKAARGKTARRGKRITSRRR